MDQMLLLWPLGDDFVMGQYRDLFKIYPLTQKNCCMYHKGTTVEIN